MHVFTALIFTQRVMNWLIMVKKIGRGILYNHFQECLQGIFNRSIVITLLSWDPLWKHVTAKCYCMKFCFQHLHKKDSSWQPCLSSWRDFGPDASILWDDLPGSIGMHVSRLCPQSSPVHWSNASRTGVLGKVGNCGKPSWHIRGLATASVFFAVLSLPWVNCGNGKKSQSTSV